MFGHYGGYHSPPCVFSMPQQAPESQHSQGYKIQISYACISCAPEKAPEFGTFSTLATALLYGAAKPKRLEMVFAVTK